MQLFDILLYASSALVFVACCIWLVVAVYIWRSPSPSSSKDTALTTNAQRSVRKSKDSPARVAVVMPVKGMHAHSVTNWRAHIQSSYPGDIQFVFVVEDESDGAYAALCELRDSVHGSLSAHLSGCSGQRSIVVACAGYAFHCSQKIYNMVEGLHRASAASEYILFLDDDVAIYPHTIQKLLDMLSCDASLFMVTGWPYDVLPSKNMPLACLCRIVYRWFSMFPLFKQRVPCVWGGCMMFRTADMKSDAFSMISNWIEGGYSDDMIVGAVCERHSRGIGWAPSLLFPSRCSSDDSLPRFVNFIQRQMFVLRTHRSPTERWVNLFLMWLTATTSATLGFNIVASVFVLVSSVVAPLLHAAPGAPIVGCPSTQVWVAASSQLLLYAGVYALHHSCVGHIRRISTPPVQVMCSPSPLPLFLAFFCVCVAIPVSAIGALCRGSIVWAGIRYCIKEGGVVSVVRGDGTTRPSSEALLESKLRYASILNSTRENGK